MRSFAIALTAVFLLANSAFAQPTDPVKFVCSPGGDIYKVQGNSSEKIFTATPPVGGCTVGPDGWVYLLSGLDIQRFDPTTKQTARNTAAPIGPQLTSDGRGLAFNGFRLFVITAGNAPVSVNSVVLMLTPTSSGVPLNFVGGTVTQLASGTGAGGDIVFDVRGNAMFTRGGALFSIAPGPPSGTGSNYSGGAQPVSTNPSIANASRLALNTCREVLFTNGVTVRRIKEDNTVADVAGLGLATGEVPSDIAVDTQNRLYVVVSSNKVYRYAPAQAVGLIPIDSVDDANASCGTVQTKTQILSQSGIEGGGIALGPNNVAISHTFAAQECGFHFDFGHMRLKFKVEQCTTSSAPFTLQVTLRLSKPADVTSALRTTLDPNATPLLFSSLGGWAGETLMKPTDFDEESRGSIQTQYWYFTQDTLVSLGLARASNEAVSAPYTQNELDDYWGATPFIDPMGCRDGCDFSKHVPYNSNPPGFCEATLFQPPFPADPTTQQTPAQGGSSLPIKFTSCPGLTLRLSVMRISTSAVPPFPPNVAQTMSVEAAGGSAIDNFFNSSGSTYTFNLKTNTYPVGLYQATINGPNFEAISLLFIVGQ